MKNRIIVAAALFFFGGTLFNMARDSGGRLTPENRHEDPNTVTLKIWAGNASAIDRWRTAVGLKAVAPLNAALEKEGSPKKVFVEAVNDPASWGDYKKKFILAADSHLGPDIICTGHEDIAAWGAAGLIVPIAGSVSEIRARDPAFADIRPELWSSVLFKGKVWGIPQDTEARVLFFSKPLLAKLGWSPARMDDLVRRINDGSFTLEDMIGLAQEAIAKKIVRPGRGYWPRPVKGSDHLQKYAAFGGKILEEDTGKLLLDLKLCGAGMSFSAKS